MLNSPILATYFCMAWSLAVDFSFIMLGAASCCFLARIYLVSWLNWILNFNQIDIKKSKEFTPVRLWSISRLIFYNSLKLLGLEYDWPFIARRNNLFFWECRSKHSTFCPIPLFWQLAPISRTLLPEDRSSSSQDSLCRPACYLSPFSSALDKASFWPNGSLLQIWLNSIWLN